MFGYEFPAIIMAIVFLCVVLVVREIVCWYWKMNDVVKLLREIRDLLLEEEDGEDENEKNLKIS